MIKFDLKLSHPICTQTWLQAGSIVSAHHLPVVQAGNLRIFVFSELRRVTAGAAVGVVVERRGLAHLCATETAGHSRTEDYQQDGYENHPTDALLDESKAS
jgi:hypothetical protein